jgi:hypothetical protein
VVYHISQFLCRSAAFGCFYQLSVDLVSFGIGFNLTSFEVPNLLVNYVGYKSFVLTGCMVLQQNKLAFVYIVY